MTKLERFLIKNSIGIVRSETTNSVYYTIDNIKIRLSDHLPRKECDCDLSIVSPVESIHNSKFVVQIPCNGKLALWSATQIINFISFLKIYKNLTTANVKRVCEVNEIKLVPPIKSRFQAFVLKKDLRRVHSHNNEIWNQVDIFWLRELISKELEMSVIFTKEFEDFLSKNKMNYRFALNLYNTILINGGNFSETEYISTVYNTIKELM